MSFRPASVSGSAPPHVDALDDVIARTRIESSIFFRARIDAPWGVDLPKGDRAPFYLVLDGACELSVPELGRHVALTTGDLAIVPHGHRHRLRSGDDAKSEPFESFRLRFPMDGHGRIEVAAGSGPRIEMIGGFFATEEVASHPLLAGLAPLVHLRGRDAATAAVLEPLAHQLNLEIDATRPGARAVLARLADLLFVQVIRIAVAEGQSIGWLRGLTDRTVGRALTELHARPEFPWTLETLAVRAGASRALLAQRFAALVGETPMRYLARWRARLAATRLKETDTSLAVIAEQVGYASEAAFSRSFKRIMQLPPGEFRRRMRSTVADLCAPPPASG